MLQDIWTFLQDKNNRSLLSWAGCGVVVVIGGAWAVLKFTISERKKSNTQTHTVSASHGGVAAGRDIRGSDIDTASQKRRWQTHDEVAE